MKVTREGESDEAAQNSGGASGAGTTEVQSGIGELEVVIAKDGLHVVVAANSGYAYSINGGSSFTHVAGTPCIYASCDGDPSLAIGQSGKVYYSWIGFPPVGTVDSLSVSINNGKSFSFVSNAVVCPTATPTVCTTPDQEHIGADRNTASKLKQDRGVPGVAQFRLQTGNHSQNCVLHQWRQDLVRANHDRHRRFSAHYGCRGRLCVCHLPQRIEHRAETNSVPATAG